MSLFHKGNPSPEQIKEATIEVLQRCYALGDEGISASFWMSELTFDQEDKKIAYQRAMNRCMDKGYIVLGPKMHLVLNQKLLATPENFQDLMKTFDVNIIPEKVVKMITKIEDAKLYVFVRTDMPSMTPGRIAAQVSHATSILHESSIPPKARILFSSWRNQVDGNFGTTIIKSVDRYDKYESYRNFAKKNYPLFGEVVDPEYYVSDGPSHKLLSKNVETCFYVLTSPSQMYHKIDSDEHYYHEYNNNLDQEMFIQTPLL